MKTCMIYHRVDLDGWFSGAIVKLWYETSPDAIDNNDDKIDFIGYNYNEPIPSLLDYDRVIMCDVSFNETDMNNLLMTKDFYYIDHHISAIKMYDKLIADLPEFNHAKGLLDTNLSACELTWNTFFPNKEMPEIVRLIGLYDTYRHKGTEEELNVLEFQYGARQVITNYEEAYNYLIQCTRSKESEYWFLQAQAVVGNIHESGKIIYEYLCTEAKSIYKMGFEIKLDNYKFICINRERFNPVNFGIDYHKDGYDGSACFHYNNGKWNFSIYNDNGNVDCSLIAKQYKGGGHFSAAGMVVDLNTMIKILNLK